jgi:hypothetical protein
MNNKTKDDVKELMQHMSNKDIEKETNIINVTESDPLFSLKNVLLKFFQKRLDVIQAEESFKQVVKDAIEEKIENNEMSPAQLINLYQKIGDQSVFSTNALFDVFKPNKEGVVSPLVQPSTREDNVTGTGDDFTPAQGEALVKLTELVEKLNKEKKQEEE